jgi:N-acylneuraminate cytidylyltransferase
VATLALIPARGGSKRLPRKNMRPFRGRPMLSYSIDAARAAGVFDEIMVSTDDTEIAEISRQHGATVPFFRSARTADDHAILLDVIAEVVDAYASAGRVFDEVCCILATAPFLRPADLTAGLERLRAEDLDSVFPVVRFDFPIWRAVAVEAGRARMFWPENMAKRSQDLPVAHHDAGQFYWLHPSICRAKGGLFTDRSGVIELPAERVQDIDTEDDWRLAELKHRLLEERAG